MREIVWLKGERNRPLQLVRPCPCGCDTRGGREDHAGYLTASNECGEGFTIWIKDPEIYQLLREALKAAGVAKVEP